MQSYFEWKCFHSGKCHLKSWWCHQIETFSTLLAICAGNSPVPVNSPHKGQWRWALMFSLICVWINSWVNTREAGDLRRYYTHYDVIIMIVCNMGAILSSPYCSDACTNYFTLLVTKGNVFYTPKMKWFTCNQMGWYKGYHRANARFAPSQWETALLCSNVSHWLGASLESALYHECLNQMQLNC